MTIRKTVTFVEEINSEYGARASPPLRRVAIAAVFKNPLAGKAAGADLKPLIDYSLELGASLTKTALADAGASPAELRAYTKAALVGTGGDLEHGAAMIHPQARHGHAPRHQARPRHHSGPRQGGPAGHHRRSASTGRSTTVGISTRSIRRPVLIHDAPRPDEIVLWIGYARGPRVNARCKGPDQKEVDALVASFTQS